MSSHPRRSSSALDEEAARWVVRMHSDQVTVEEERAFAHWLADSAENRRAYDEQANTWAAIGALRSNREARRALYPLRSFSHPNLQRRGLIAAAFAAFLAFGAGAAFLSQPHASGQRYATGLGEQRRLSLSDGSIVTLNTDSVVRTEFDGRERRLWLEKGQAFFSVAHDSARPFRVFVQDNEVRAVGTAFDVRLDGENTQVTLDEGVVVVFDDATAKAAKERAPVAILKPGQQIIVCASEPMRIAWVDLRRVNAWRSGRMVLDAEPLSTAIAEINRYNARKILLADPGLNDLAVSGVFQTSHPDAFIEALIAGFPVDVVSQDATAIRLRRRAAQ